MSPYGLTMEVMGCPKLGLAGLLLLIRRMASWFVSLGYTPSLPLSRRPVGDFSDELQLRSAHLIVGPLVRMMMLPRPLCGSKKADLRHSSIPPDKRRH